MDEVNQCLMKDLSSKDSMKKPFTLHYVVLISDQANQSNLSPVQEISALTT